MFLHIKIVSIGKVKNTEINNLVSSYKKMLTPFCKLEEIELTAEAFKRESDKEKAKQKEGERILNYIQKNPAENFFLLEETGKEFSSVNFSKKLFSVNGCITFIIAGTLGFDKKIKEMHLNKISLSQLTFPHEITRLLLFEQIYRAISIENGKKYHY